MEPDTHKNARIALSLPADDEYALIQLQRALSRERGGKVTTSETVREAIRFRHRARKEEKR